MSQQEPMPDPHGDRRIEETAIEARQGRSGRPMLWVMGISTIAAAAILLLIVVFSGVFAPTPNTGETPKPTGPFATQVHKEQTPAGPKSVPAQGAPAQNQQ